MNTDESRAVETEERKSEQAEAQTIPSIWVPAASADVKRESSVEQTVEVPPAAAVPQFTSELAFACVLMPRFREHYLAGDIVDSLREWMQQACISYGWRLTEIAVRPGYMQWVMNVPLNANPAQFMRVIRRFTSEKIFEDFPRFKQMNISGEFWAPGNFVVPGSQMQTTEQVNEFMLQTRRQQGYV